MKDVDGDNCYVCKNAHEFKTRNFLTTFDPAPSNDDCYPGLKALGSYCKAYSRNKAVH